MAPSTTIRAVILLWRKAATKVIVSHAPSGTVPITLSPLGARPLTRARFVLARGLVDKHQPGGIKHALLSIQRQRARATSARCRSAGFF